MPYLCTVKKKITSQVTTNNNNNKQKIYHYDRYRILHYRNSLFYCAENWCHDY